jgi:LuxR family maltose regulon positive regulatory protein
LKLSRQFDQVIDRLIVSEMFLARLKLARRDTTGALDRILLAEQISHQKNYTFRLSEIAFTRVRILLDQGNLDEAAQLVWQYEMPLMQARFLIAQGKPSEALALVEPQRQQAEDKRLPERLLLVKAVQAVVLFAQGHKDQAVQLLAEVLTLAELGGNIRLFLDEGPLMAQLLLETAGRGVMPGYVARLLAAFEAEKRHGTDKPGPAPAGALVEPLSPRELEILKLISHGLSNREIGERLFLALDTIKGYNRKLFDKLQVKSRTEAVARAHDLGLV